MTKTLSVERIIAAIVLAFLLLFLPTAASAAREQRTVTLTRVLVILADVTPEQAESESAVADALTQGQGGGGNNGGASSGNGGNGGNASPGGLIRAGSVVSNATAVNAINTTIVRIGSR